MSVATVSRRRAPRSDPVGRGPTSTDGSPATPDRAVADTPAIVRSVEATLTDPSPTAPLGSTSLEARWLGRIAYRDAYVLQKRLVDERATGRIGDQLLLLEHPAVLTLGKHSDPTHILATAEDLRASGVAVERVERGGEVTYHGPGQLVAYPIVRLHERGLLLRPFVRALEAALIDTCASLGVAAERRDGHPGCWCDPTGPAPRKIGALGLRVERGVSYHGIALNVTVDLGDFDLIDPCGMPGVVSTSIATELGRPTELPTTESVERAASIFAAAFAAAIDAPLAFAG